MANLFFSFPGELQDATKTVFNALGTLPAANHDSLNVLGGTYTALSLLGFKIKLEANSYDYEDKFNYMLSVNEDFLANLRVDDEMEEGLADIIAKLLVENTSLEIAQEKESGLVFHPVRG
jgi:hypothetical protein